MKRVGAVLGCFLIACSADAGGVAGAPCTDGVTIMVDTISSQAMGGVWGNNLAVDARGVYFTVYGFGAPTEHAVVRVPLRGGGWEILWHGPGIRLFATGMAVDDRVYFPVLLPTDTPPTYGLLAVPADGGDLQMLDQLPSSGGAVALDAANVYVAAGALVRVPRAGGTPSMYPSTSGPVEWVAAEGGVIYFATTQDLMKLDASGNAVQLAALPSLPPCGGNAGSALAVYGGNAYVLANDSVVALPLDGSASSVVTSGLSRPTSVAVDASGIYVADGLMEPQANARVLRIRPGAEPVVLAENVAAWTLALNPTTVYWAGLGQVGRVGKCSR
jgi:hypothetical protein